MASGFIAATAPVGETDRGLDGECVARDRLVVERPVRQQHHLAGPLVLALVETDRLAILLGRVAARYEVVQRRVGHRRRRAEPPHLQHWLVGAEFNAQFDTV